MTYQKKSSSFQLFWQLVREEFIGFIALFKDKVINQGIWVAVSVFSTVYLMGKQFDVASGFGLFTLTGCIATTGLFEAYPNIFAFVQDFEGDRRISYYLTLPLASWMIFAKQMVCMALRGMAIGFAIIPLGKLVLWHEFILSDVAWFKFALVFILANLFIGAFTLWLATMIMSIQKLGNLWARFIFPVWFLCGFQFSWATLHNVVPPLAYSMLLNPMTYVMEGIRATVIGQEGYLNIWVCIGMLILFTLFFAWHSISRLKKRLDAV